MDAANLFVKMLFAMAGEERAVYTNDGMYGAYNGATIWINLTTDNDFKVRVYSRNGDCILFSHTGTLERAHKLAEEIIDEVGEVKS